MGNYFYHRTKDSDLVGVWRPERRNRNIGTKASGFSQSNDMRIPESWQDRHGNYSIFYERMVPAQKDVVEIDGKTINLLYETTHENFTYGCSPADVIKIFDLVKTKVPTFPDIVAFRQPTRKQQQQSPVWGRFLHFAQFGKIEGTAIVLEAQELGHVLKWSKRMSIEDRAEYERLLADGHQFRETTRSLQAELTEASVRNTVLYRTLLHELGHLADHHQKVLNPKNALDPNEDVASDLYFSRATSERESFAHAFADRLGQSLRENGAIPFAHLS